MKVRELFEAPRKATKVDVTVILSFVGPLAGSKERIQRIQDSFMNSSMSFKEAKFERGTFNGDSVTMGNVWVNIGDKSYTHNDFIALKAQVLEIAKEAYGNNSEFHKPEVQLNSIHTDRTFPLVIMRSIVSDGITYEANTCNLVATARFNSFHNIHKTLKTCESIRVWSPEKVQSDVLGLLKVKGVKEIVSGHTSVADPEWLKIIKRHFRDGKDILACQEELIEAGLKEYAKL